MAIQALTVDRSNMSNTTSKAYKNMEGLFSYKLSVLVKWVWTYCTPRKNSIKLWSCGLSYTQTSKLKSKLRSKVMGSSGKRVWNSKELQSTKRKELASWGKDVRGKYLKEVRSIRKWDKSIGRLGQRSWEEKESGGSRRQKQRSIVATIRKLWSRMKKLFGTLSRVDYQIWWSGSQQLAIFANV